LEQRAAELQEIKTRLAEREQDLSDQQAASVAKLAMLEGKLSKAHEEYSQKLEEKDARHTIQVAALEAKLDGCSTVSNEEVAELRTSLERVRSEKIVAERERKMLKTDLQVR
jgi:hypothetical protein